MAMESYKKSSESVEIFSTAHTTGDARMQRCAQKSEVQDQGGSVV